MSVRPAVLPGLSPVRHRLLSVRLDIHRPGPRGGLSRFLLRPQRGCASAAGLVRALPARGPCRLHRLCAGRCLSSTDAVGELASVPLAARLCGSSLWQKVPS